LSPECPPTDRVARSVLRVIAHAGRLIGLSLPRPQLSLVNLVSGGFQRPQNPRGPTRPRSQQSALTGVVLSPCVWTPTLRLGEASGCIPADDLSIPIRRFARSASASECCVQSPSTENETNPVCNSCGGGGENKGSPRRDEVPKSEDRPGGTKYPGTVPEGRTTHMQTTAR